MHKETSQKSKLNTLVEFAQKSKHHFVGFFYKLFSQKLRSLAYLHLDHTNQSFNIKFPLKLGVYFYFFRDGNYHA